VSLLLYGVTDRPLQSSAGRGVSGARLRSVSAHGLVAVVSEPRADRMTPTAEALWEFEQAIERLMAGHALLPARFASVLEDEQSLLTMLEDKSAQLRGAIERIRGAVEFGISVGWQLEPATDADSGTAYLLERLALHRRASELARVLDPLAQLARCSRQRVLSRPGVPLTAAYLVAESDADAFISLVAELDGELDGADLVCTGPWPPYSFVEEMN
jgi:hypothetical protein